MRQGQFMVYSQGKTKESCDIINNNDYVLSVKKTWIESTSQWHIQFTSKLADYPCGHTWECFLSHEELKQLREFL